ncbi:hypothetical protein LCGC14_0704660 [marine sediment metagenome]|uniref:Uncharacterized protein n=1 Tax=marine sediment metagenome TaxID=412755 RepID=A0A0F9QLJ2_9ZZZZ|nr:hypothetical protein [archaeon]
MDGKLSESAYKKIEQETDRRLEEIKQEIIKEFKEKNQKLYTCQLRGLTNYRYCMEINKTIFEFCSDL